ncbi:hypothetical protein LguiB_034400 [Lonicera macranthoides]
MATHKVVSTLFFVLLSTAGLSYATRALLTLEGGVGYNEGSGKVVVVMVATSHKNV